MAHKSKPTVNESLSTADLSARWGVSQEALRSWRFRGTGPNYFRPSGQPRGSVRYALKDVIAWEKKHMGAKSNAK